MADARKRKRDGHQPQAITIGSLPFIEVDWDTALDVVARKFAARRRRTAGSASPCWLRPSAPTRRTILVNKLTRQVMATNSIDHCARL